MPSADLTSSPEGFLNQTYDYLIIDGGTAGLVVASRLSANPDLRVGVIEAGDAGFDDPNFTNPGKISAMLHNPKYDWMYQSTLSGRFLTLYSSRLSKGSLGAEPKPIPSHPPRESSWRIKRRQFHGIWKTFRG